MAAGVGHPRALFKSELLVDPMVKRRRGHDKVESAALEGKLFPRGDEKADAIIIRELDRDAEHRRCGIDTDELCSRRTTVREKSEQIPGPAPDIEDAQRIRGGGKGQVSCASGDFVVEAPEPPVLVGASVCVKSSDVAMCRHKAILSEPRRPSLIADPTGVDA